MSIRIRTPIFRVSAPDYVYTVRFDARELWGPRAEPNAVVHLDLWEPYLEPAAPAESEV